MKHFFAFACHVPTNALASNLIYLSDFDEVVIYLHIDAKSNLASFSDLPGKFKFTSNRIAVHWGHYSQVLATVELMRSSVESDFDYFSLLSGDDFFLGALADFNRFVGEADGKDFIDAECSLSVDRLISRLCGMQYESSTYFRSGSLPGRAYRRIIREAKWFLNRKSFRISCLPVLAKGCNWFTVSREFVFDFLEFFDRHQAELSQHFLYSLSSDEILFPSFAASYRPSSIASQSMDLGKEGLAALRYIDWSSSKEKPKILALDELSNLRNRDAVFFARKVNREISQEKLNSLR